MTDKNESEKYTIEIGKKAKHKLDMLMGNLKRKSYKFRDGGRNYDQIIDFLLDMLEFYTLEIELGVHDHGDDDYYDYEEMPFKKEGDDWEKEWTKYDSEKGDKQ